MNQHLLTCTSTGGLIALGLGVKGWSVEECISKFEGLVDKAFTARPGTALPVVSPLVTGYHRSTYETKPLEEALIGVFGTDECLFGGRRPPKQYKSTKKVVVTTASSGMPVILSNYSRKGSLGKCKCSQALWSAHEQHLII